MKTFKRLFIFSILFFCWQISFASDSTNISKPKTSTSYYVETTTAPPTVTNARYDLLPTCPAAAYNCPDINGQGGSATTCPDYCTVTRSPASLSGTSGTNRVTGTVTDAVCPPYYAQVASYNMQNEATYNPSPPTIRPISGMGNYNNYVAAGYSCTTYGSRQESGEYCGGTYKDGQIVDSVDNANGNVTWIQNSYRTSCYCSAFGCGATCSCSIAGTNPRWTYRYYYMQCTPPSGLYLTGKQAAVSIVCARPKASWKPVYTPPSSGGAAKKPVAVP